jgi:hypothetical protein
MVDLEIGIEMHPEHVGACIYDASENGHMFYEVVPAHQYAERPGAAMRAIVRAAASEHVPRSGDDDFTRGEHDL